MGNTLEMQTNAKENLKEHHVISALQKDKGNGIHLLSWRTEDFTQKGDHYIGIITSLHITYRLANKDKTETYIVKLGSPQTNKAVRDMVTQGCNKELMFYQKILPMLNNELQNAGLVALRTPQCYFANDDAHHSILILSDLRSKDFRPYPGKTCLDIPHINLVLQELARFHASSYLLEKTIGREAFIKNCKYFEKEWYNVTEDAIAFFKNLFDGNIENAVAILKTLRGDDRAIDYLNKIKPNVYYILEDQMKIDNKFTTLCHADSISNNVLFRYNESSEPVEAVLIDFQIVRRASLVTDLHLLLNISVYGSDRQQNLKSFLQTYYESFKEVLTAGGHQMPFSFKELVQEYHQKFLFGLLWGLAVIPMMCSGGEISDWTGDEDIGENKSAVPKRQDSVDSKISGKHSELRARFMPLFNELIETGIDG